MLYSMTIFDLATQRARNFIFLSTMSTLNIETDPN